MALFPATAIIKNAKEKLKRLLQNGFQDCFQHFTFADRSVRLKSGIILKKM